MYFRVGTPMGWCKISEEPLKYDNRIEVRGKAVMLDFFLSNLWVGLDACKTDDEAIRDTDERLIKCGLKPKNDEATPKQIKKLIEMGVIIYARSNEELFDIIKDYKVIRNGFPYFDDTTIENFQKLKHLIVLDEDISVSENQIYIWRKADGIKTLEQIYEDFSDMSLSVFIENIIYLNDKTTVFLF